MLNSEERIRRFRPEAEDELLLKALFLDSDAANQSYRVWRRIVDFDDFSPGNHDLLPLLYHRGLIAADDPLIHIAKGLYKRTLYINSMKFRESADFIGELANAGIPVLLLKGAALVNTAYPTPALRPMKDVDIAVPAAKLADALSVVAAYGLHMPANRNDPLGKLILEKHGEECVKESGMRIDLHWNIFYAARQNKLDEQYWQCAHKASFCGQTIKLLAPEEQFLHLAVHGISYLPRFQVRWIADVLSVAEMYSLDWERIVALAVQRRLLLQLKDILHYLKREFLLAVPEELIATIDALPESYQDYVVYSYHSWPQYPQPFLDSNARYPKIAASLFRTWRIHQIEQWRRLPADGAPAKTNGNRLVAFLAEQHAKRLNVLPRPYR